MVLLCCPWSYLNDELRWGRVGDLSSYERSVPGVQLDGMIPYPTCNQFGDDNADAEIYSRKWYWLLLYFGMRMTTLRGVCRVVEILSWLLIDDTILWRDGSDRILPWYPSQSPTLWVNNVGCSRWRCTVIGTSIIVVFVFVIVDSFVTHILQNYWRQKIPKIVQVDHHTLETKFIWDSVSTAIVLQRNSTATVFVRVAVTVCGHGVQHSLARVGTT
jgi:hypothetical protein